MNSYLRLSPILNVLNNQIWLILVLFILTVSLRLIFLETYWDNPSSLWDDEYDYVYLSKYINEGGSWISETMPNSRPPLLSIILAPIAEYDPYVMRIYLVCLSSTSTIFLFLLYS